MKHILIFLFAIAVISCGTPQHQGPTYYYSTELKIPDSLKEKHAQYIKELVSASNFHMTGGDYEDPEDVIAKAESVADRVYGVEVEGLDMVVPNSYTRKFIPADQLTPELKNMLDSLKRGGKAAHY